MVTIKSLVYLNYVLTWVQTVAMIICCYLVEPKLGILIVIAIITQVVLSLLLQDAINNMKAAYTEKAKGEKL